MGNNKSRKELIENLCADTWKDLYRFIYYKVQNREEAQDITQETYLKAISYLKGNDITVLEHRNYLKAISINIIRDRWRARKRKGFTLNLEEIDPEEIAAADFTDEIDDRNEIEEAMGHLTIEQKTVITLRIIDGNSVSNTAKLMNIKEGNVRVIQFRALKELANIINKPRR